MLPNIYLNPSRTPGGKSTATAFKTIVLFVTNIFIIVSITDYWHGSSKHLCIENGTTKHFQEIKLNFVHLNSGYSTNYFISANKTKNLKDPPCKKNPETQSSLKFEYRITFSLLSE